MEVSVGKSPTFMTERLEKSNIRSLNNLIDVTNYINARDRTSCARF